MVNTFTFLSSQYLYLFLLLPALILTLWLALKRKAEILKYFSTGQQIAKTISNKKLFFHYIFIALLILALARPITGYQNIKIFQNSSDILLVVDISQSMLANDIKPGRLTAVKRKLYDSLEAVKIGPPGVRVGILLFAGSPYIYCPLTEDYSVLKVFVESLSTSLIKDPGSNLNSALDLAAKTLKASQSQSSMIMLFTDGEAESNRSNKFSPDKYTYPIHILGFGTTKGAPIKQGGGRYLRDSDGNFVISKLEESSLRKIADQSGGSYQRSSATRNDVESLLKEHFAHARQVETETSIRVYNEVGHYMVLSAFLILFVMAMFKMPATLFLFFLVAFRPSIATAVPEYLAPSKESQLAYNSFMNSDFASAASHYEQALLENPHDPALLSGLAASLYKQKQYKESAKYYEQLTTNSSNPRNRFEAYYNLGNAQLLSGAAKEAIKSYEQALRIKQSDKMATENLEIAKKLAEKQQEEQQKQNNQDQPQNKEQESDNEDQEDSKQDQKQKSDQNKEQQSKDQQQSKSDQSKDKENSNQQKDSKDQKGNSEDNQQEDQSKPSEDSNKDDQTNSNDNREQESSQSEDQQAQSNEETKTSASSMQQLDQKSLSKKEAEAWLDSLSDNPVLLRQKGRSRNQGGQTW